MLPFSSRSAGHLRTLIDPSSAGAALAGGRVVSTSTRHPESANAWASVRNRKAAAATSGANRREVIRTWGWVMTGRQ